MPTYNAPMETNAASPLRSLLPLAGRALELALDRALALDPDTRAGLAALDGRRLVLTLEAPRIALGLTVQDGRIKVGPGDATDEADLSLLASAGALLAQLLPRRDDAPPVGKLRVSGDADLARRLQKLALGFDPDFDAAFARVFGDVLGVQIARALRAGLARGRSEAGRFARDVAEYLVEERRDVVGRVEQAIFFDEVDALRDAVDRIDARVKRLLRR